MNEEATKTDPRIEQPEVAPTPKYVFPSLDKGPACFYDDEAHVAWLGIPFDKVQDPHFVTAAVDRCKFDFLQFLDRFFQAKKAREALTQKTGIAGLFDRVARR